MPARPTAAQTAVAFLAAVVVSVVAALTLTAAPAVADNDTLARTGVAASNLDLGDGVGMIEDISPGQGRETGLDSYDLSSGSRVATRAPSGRMQGDAGSVQLGRSADGVMDPSTIRFTQDSASQSFRGGGTVSGLADDLGLNPAHAESVPPIRLVEHEGSMFSLDNRRLVAFQEAGVPVPYRMATSREIRNLWTEHFTTQNGGTSIQMRLW